MDNVSLQLTGKKFDEFAKRGGLIDQINNKYPDFGGYSQVFKLRNRIVHNGDIDFTESQARTCFDFTIAILGVAKAINNEIYRRFFSPEVR